MKTRLSLILAMCSSLTLEAVPPPGITWGGNVSLSGNVQVVSVGATTTVLCNSTTVLCNSITVMCNQ